MNGIDEIIAQALKEFGDQPEPSDATVVSNREAVEKISNAAAGAFSSQSGTELKKLLGFFSRAIVGCGLNVAWAGAAFWSTEAKLFEAAEARDGGDSNRLRGAARLVNEAGVIYFAEALEDQMRDLDLADQLAEIKARINPTHPGSVGDYEPAGYTKYMHEALRRRQAYVERHLEILREQTSNREVVHARGGGDDNDKHNDKQSKKVQRTKGETLDRTCLFFYYLFEYFKVKSRPVARARILSDLTGFSSNTIERFLRYPHQKASSNFAEYQKDMDYVRDLFTELKLTEVLKSIANDLDDQERETAQ